MKIGFYKLGLKTYFEKDKSKAEGFNHELCDTFDIFKKRGHECVMLSVSDKYEKYEGNDLDYIFLFNGPMPFQESGRKMCMFKNYSFPIIDFINSNNIPYVYFWTDCRYDITKNNLFNRQPKLILSQEKEYYGHLEKLILYNKKISESVKDIEFSIMMNDTDNKRSKDTLSVINWLGRGEIIGKWKQENKFIKEPIAENKINEYLSRVNFSYNQAVNPQWVSQKYYEMLLNGVVCFYKKYDNDNLIIDSVDFRRVKDEIDLEEKIKLLNNDNSKYLEILKKQREELREDYFNGDFIYNFIISKL